MYQDEIFENALQETKAESLKQLQGDFKDSINKFLLQLGSIDSKVDQMMRTGEEDTANVNSLNSGIQKIEDKNHRIELRNQNKTSGKHNRPSGRADRCAAEI